LLFGQYPQLDSGSQSSADNAGGLTSPPDRLRRHPADVSHCVIYARILTRLTRPALRADPGTWSAVLAARERMICVSHSLTSGPLDERYLTRKGEQHDPPRLHDAVVADAAPAAEPSAAD
jgi:hypothetical protein